MKLLATLCAAGLSLSLLGCQHDADARSTASGRPGADCAAVGEQLASFELGNYAEPEDRAPVVARHEARCLALQLSKDEAACVARAADRWSARDCAPRLFPELTPAAPAACTGAVGRMKAVLEQQASSFGNDPKLKLWLARTMSVMQEACEQDHWPAQMVACMASSTELTSLVTRCNQQMPAELQRRFQDRMTKAMNDLLPQLTAPPSQPAPPIPTN